MRKEAEVSSLFDLQKIDTMVLVTAKERRKGYSAPLGTIYYVYDGEQRSIWPQESNYASIKAVYEEWKQTQADQARQQRDERALSKLLVHMQERKRMDEQQSTPDLLANAPANALEQGTVDIAEVQEQVKRLAVKTWHGRAQRHGNEKVAVLRDDSPLLQGVRPMEWHVVPEHETLEYFIDLDTFLLHVRRHHITPQPHEQQRVATKRVLSVVGDQKAHERGAAPAYHRTISTRLVTFTCQGCMQIVTQERLPGPLPHYCSDICRSEAQRQKTLERVHRLREQRKKRKHSAETMAP